MSLPLRPHTVRILRATAVVAGGVVSRRVWNEVATRSGMVSERNARATQVAWGLEVGRPALLYLDVEEADEVVTGDRVRVGTRSYRVVAGPRAYTAESRTSHAVWLLEREGHG